MGTEIVGVVIFILVAILCVAIARLLSKRRSHVMAISAFMLIGSGIAHDMVLRGNLKNISFESITIAFITTALMSSFVTSRRGQQDKNEKK